MKNFQQLGRSVLLVIENHNVSTPMTISVPKKDHSALLYYNLTTWNTEVKNRYFFTTLLAQPLTCEWTYNSHEKNNKTHRMAWTHARSQKRNLFFIFVDTGHLPVTKSFHRRHHLRLTCPTNSIVYLASQYYFFSVQRQILAPDQLICYFNKKRLRFIFEP